MNGVRVQATGLVAGLVVLLSGCTGSEGGPRVLPSASVPPSASASPAPTGINAPTAQGASEFVRFFYAEISRGFAERDPAIVSRLSLPTCKTCKLYVDSITQIRLKDQRPVGGDFTITFAVAPADSGARARVNVGFDFAAYVLYDATGKVVEREKAQANVEEQVELRREGDVWRVATVKRVVRR